MNDDDRTRIVACMECNAKSPRGLAYTKDWILLSYRAGVGILSAEFCSWECLHRYTVGAVFAEGIQWARKTDDPR